MVNPTFIRMKPVYKKALNILKKKLKNSEVAKVFDVVSEKCNKTIKKLSEEGSPLDEDLAKILGLIQGLLILKKKKISRKKKILYSLIIASLIVLAGVAAVKIYDQVKNDEDAKKNIKKFLKKLDLENLASNPMVQKIRRKIRESVE
ncbi:Uncharacterised protein [Candidatus Tiddalikarchaeum anstoanum]|nr:Uncharacterised protein [Candidatus Tiddalikarchaeum anstoanum]